MIRYLFILLMVGCGGSSDKEDENTWLIDGDAVEWLYSSADIYVLYDKHGDRVYVEHDEDPVNEMDYKTANIYVNANQDNYFYAVESINGDRRVIQNHYREAKSGSVSIYSSQVRQQFYGWSIGVNVYSDRELNFSFSEGGHITLSCEYNVSAGGECYYHGSKYYIDNSFDVAEFFFIRGVDLKQDLAIRVKNAFLKEIGVI